MVADPATDPAPPAADLRRQVRPHLGSRQWLAALALDPQADGAIAEGPARVVGALRHAGRQPAGGIRRGRDDPAGCRAADRAADVPPILCDDMGVGDGRALSDVDAPAARAGPAHRAAVL